MNSSGFSVSPVCTEILPGGAIANGGQGMVHLFDGETSKRVRVGASKVVYSMDQDSLGRIYAGGREMGVIVPDPDGGRTFHSFLPMLPDSIRESVQIPQVLCAPEGPVWFLGDMGKTLYCYDGDTLTYSRFSKYARLDKIDGRIIMSRTDRGLFEVKQGMDLDLLEGSRPLLEGRKMVAVHPHPSKEAVWTAFTKTDGLFNFHPGKGKIKAVTPEREKGGKKDRWMSTEISDACPMDPDANPYGAAYALGTSDKGVILIDAKGEQLYRFGKEKDVLSSFVWDVTLGESGDLWVATRDGLTFIHTGVPFTYAKKGKTLQGTVWDITRPPHKGAPLLLGTMQGVWHWEDQKQSFSRVGGRKDIGCYQLLSWPPVGPDERSSGTSRPSPSASKVYLPDRDRLLTLSFSKEDPGKPGEVRKVLSEGTNSIAPIPSEIMGAPDSNPGLLIGGTDKLFVLEPGKGNDPRGPDVLFQHPIPEMAPGVQIEKKQPQGDSLRIWVGLYSRGALAIDTDTSFSDHRTTKYDSTDGLPSGMIILFPGAKGKGTLMSTYKGLYRFENGNFVPYDRFPHTSRSIFDLEWGANERIWIAQNEKTPIKGWSYKGEKDELIGDTVFRGMAINTVNAIEDEGDRVWFGGTEGLARYHPDMRTDIERDWTCSISRVEGMDDSLIFKGVYSEHAPQHGIRAGDTVLERIAVQQQPEAMTPELPYSQNRLKFRFAARSPDDQEAVHYRYKLVGHDTAWSELTHETKKEYTNLWEGSYTFKVKAVNIYDKESSTATYRFRILPPWYRTWTAYSGYSLAGIGFIWLLLWLNSRRLVAHKQRLERIVRERTQEIREQQKATEEQKEEAEKQRDLAEERRAKIEEAHEEITQSIEYARKIQYALLLSEEHVSPHLPEHFILFKPQATVSGDFYWAKEHHGFLYFAAVDCTGHGVPGAFMSMLGISQLNEIMNTDATPTPGDILTELRDRVVRELSSEDPESSAKDGMDAAMVKLPVSRSKSQTPNSKKIEFAGANNPLYVVKTGIADHLPAVEGVDPVGSTHVSTDQKIKPFKKTTDGFEVKGDKMAVGYEPDATDAFTTTELEVPAGAMLYMFSDGYADQFGGPKGKKFRYGPFKELLARVHTLPPEEQKAELDRVFEEWKENQEQIDDVCVIGIRIEG